MDHTLIDQIALADDPDDEEAVENILRTLLVPPVISLQAAALAADYVSVLVLGGYCSVGALQTLEQDHMVAVGIPPGHAQRILRAIRVQEPRVQSQLAGQVPQLPASVAQAYQSNSSGSSSSHVVGSAVRDRLPDSSGMESVQTKVEWTHALAN